MQQPTRLLSNELRDQPEGKVTRWAAFCVFWEDCLVSERVFMPDCTYFLVPELTEPGRGAEVCLVSKRMFIPDDTSVLVKKYYILTRRNKRTLNMVACSATSVESCLYRRVLKGSVRARPRLWVGKTIDIALFLTVTEAENWYFSRMCGQKLTRWLRSAIILRE